MRWKIFSTPEVFCKASKGSRNVIECPDSSFGGLEGVQDSRLGTKSNSRDPSGGSVWSQILEVIIKTPLRSHRTVEPSYLKRDFRSGSCFLKADVLTWSRFEFKKKRIRNPGPRHYWRDKPGLVGRFLETLPFISDNLKSNRKFLSLLTSNGKTK